MEVAGLWAVAGLVCTQEVPLWVSCLPSPGTGHT